MDYSNHRNRLVVFRLTEVEYETLKRRCAEKGARNLSEFTRTRVLGAGSGDVPAVLLQKRFLAIEQQLESLKEAMGRLSRLVEAGVQDPAVPNNSNEIQDIRL